MDFIESPDVGLCDKLNMHSIFEHLSVGIETTPTFVIIIKVRVDTHFAFFIIQMFRPLRAQRVPSITQ